jgi:hypothetical protein
MRMFRNHPELGVTSLLVTLLILIFGAATGTVQMNFSDGPRIQVSLFQFWTDRCAYEIAHVSPDHTIFVEYKAPTNNKSGDSSRLEIFLDEFYPDRNMTTPLRGFSESYTALLGQGISREVVVRTEKSSTGQFGFVNYPEEGCIGEVYGVTAYLTPR